MDRPMLDFQHRPVRCRRILSGVAAAVAVLAVLLVGCVVESRTSSWDDFDKLADPKPGEPTAAARDRAAAPRGWTIPVAEFTGPDRLKEAYRLASTLRESGQLADVWFNEVGDAARVNVGRYRLSGDADAKAGLAAVRAAEIGGRRPYRDAEARRPSPPPAAPSASTTSPSTRASAPCWSRCSTRATTATARSPPSDTSSSSARAGLFPGAIPGATPSRPRRTSTTARPSRS